jgi:putative methyltransferase
MRNIYFLQLPLSNHTACLPQAVGTIWSYCNQFEEVSSKYNLAGVWWKDPIDIVDPYILAASCYMWNWQETYEIIKDVKSKYPNCKVVVGGPDPEYTSQWCAQHPEVDAVIAYYGEETLRQVLVSDTLDVPGIVTKDFNNASQAVYADPKLIPSPYLNGFFDNLLLGNTTKNIRAVFEGNRGCPYSCSFCDIGSKMYQKIQMFDTDRCIAELDWICENNVNIVDVADSNFGIFPRDEQIVDYIVEQKQLGRFNGSFMPTWAKTHGEQIIKLAKKLQTSGVDKIFGFSLQSTNPDTLKNVKRKNTYDIQGFIPILEDMQQLNMSSYTELIFPMPGDTAESFKSGLHELLDMPVSFEMIQINSLSRLSNTEFNTGFPNMEWVNIKGTAKPYDNGVTDEICVATDSIDRESVFESFFYARNFVIPMYWYGLTTYLADHLHSNGTSRSKFLNQLYNKMFSEKLFADHKAEVKAHYFNSIDNDDHIGYYVNNCYYTDTAYSHLFYVQNHIFDYLKDSYPAHADIIIANYNDFKPIKDLTRWMTDIHIKGRFNKSWKI